MPFKKEAEQAAAELSKLEALGYEIKLANENHEEIVLKCYLRGFDKTPCVELEVPAYNDRAHGVSQPRMYVTLELSEFDKVAEHVARFRNMIEVANV